ncbi:glycosyltransferase family 2 protein [Urechidicola croceus]|uniref:Glycosyltransferase 2-like domain-containing protein n=1 Tax=Urechidicola croceus TaxID=1850246 RepID=A0A1D8P6A2_9FLAO|nr:glycosyltransferase family 2 protein [Urechidicola croceus]AOW20105.1 hypothetical protein LPB138_05160 [Urechidicola croceus]
MILSIVLPVYNVSEYIEKCIRSCSNQDIPITEYEIIAINDGSPDDSLHICEKLAAEVKNLKIVSQENRGLSGARNTGLRHSKGEYVWFVDSDDWINDNCLKEITLKLKSIKSDIFWLGHNVVTSSKVLDSFIPKEIEKPVSGEDFFENHLDNLFYIWKFIYKRKFLLDNDLTFYEGILYEDLEFTPRALHIAKTCYNLPKVYYHYLMREGSIVNNIKLRNINDRFFICNRILEKIENTSVSEKYYKVCYEIVVRNVIGTIKMAVRSGVRLPTIVQEVVGKIKIQSFLDTRLKKEMRFIKLNLGAYYAINRFGYKIYKKLKK